jgi:ATPase family associated with various cellular activities (AAA)
MKFVNLFRKKKEDIYEILLPGEKLVREQPFTPATQTAVQQVRQREQRTDEQIINVVGREEELDFLDHLFLSNEDMNILYNGSPAAAKTMILKAIQQKFPDECYFFDFSLTTGKGFIQLLVDKRNSETNMSHRVFGNKPNKKILLINEIDKIKPISELNVLLDLLDRRTIDKVVYKKEYYVKFSEGLRVFATCNNVDRLSEAIRSRFCVRPLEDYSFEQFVTIGKALGDKYLKVKDERARESVAEEIAIRTYRDKEIKDVRRLIDFFKVYNIYNGSKTPNEILSL